jgi:predicted transcriptional regulator
MRRDDIQAMSAVVFGNSNLVEVALALDAQSRVATVRQIASALAIGDSTVRPILERLVAAGALRELPRIGKRGPRYFEVTDELLWKRILELAKHVRRHAPSATGVSTP